MHRDPRRIQRDLEERRFRALVGGWSACTLAAAAGLVLLTVRITSVLGLMILGVSLVVMGLICFIAARQYRRLGRGLEAHGAATCPCCGNVANANPRCCRRLPAGWSAADTAAYWADRATDVSMAFCLRRGNPPSSLAWWIEKRGQVILILVGFSGLILVAAIITAVFDPRLLVADTPMFALVLFVWPLWIATIVWIHSQRKFARRGHCGSCGHAIPPGAHSAKAKCLECGKALTRGTTVYSSVAPSLRWMLGVFYLPLLFFPLWDLVNDSGAGAGVFGILPTTALVQLAAAEGGTNTLAWNELARRQLTPDEHATLVQAILAERTLDPGFWTGSDRGKWLGGAIEDGLIAPSDLSALRCETWIPDLEIPQSLRAGDAFTVILSGERRRHYAPPATGTAILFDGVSVDGGPFIGGETTTLWDLDLDRRDFSKDGYRHFAVSLTIDAPGDHVLRARYWLLDRPFGHLGDEVERSDDGRPIRPAHSTFLLPVTIEETISVEPAMP
jgi:predicted RNA-binding Zn-ribbon protein involved in translation (DUF1610 family)